MSGEVAGHYKMDNILHDKQIDDSDKRNRKSSYNVETDSTKEGSKSEGTKQDGKSQQPAIQYRKERQHLQPLWICYVMAKRPKTIFFSLLLVHMSLLLITGAMVMGQYDILPVDFKGVPLDLEHEDVFLRALAWQNRETDAILPTSPPSTEDRDDGMETLVLYYQADNVFTADNLQFIQTLEEQMTNVADYALFCMKQSDGTCSKPFSILRLFDGTFGPLFNDTSFSDVPQTLQNAMNVPEISHQLNFFLGKNSIVSVADGIAKSAITRTAFYFVYNTELETFMVDNYRQKLLDLHSNGLGSMSLIYSCETLFVYDVQRQVIFDMMLAVGSFAFIFLFMLFQTKSLFVTCLGIFSILTSFFGANMIYRIAFDYKYFGIFHVLSIFIILGIGADDVFVYFDTWRATSHEHMESLEQRLSECYRRASKSMLITSLTTMVAFISNAFSPVLAISSFGLFSATLVLINYLSVITFFPSVVLMHHLYFENWTWPCFRPCYHQRSHTVSSETVTVTDVAENQTPRKNIVVRFFYGHYFIFITHKVVRWIILASFLALIVVFIVFVKDLKPDEESTKIFKDDHNYQMANDRRKNAFKPSGRDDIIRVYMVWGLRLQDRSNCHKTDGEKCTGKTVWDEAFDLNPSPAQLQMKKMCTDLQNLPESTNANLHIRNSSLTGKLEVDCFLDDMENFLVNESGKAVFGGSADFSIPFSESKISHLMTSLPQFYNISAISSNFYRYFETAAAYWLHDGYSSNVSSDYTQVLGFTLDQYDTLPLLNSTWDVYGTRLRYAAIIANTSLIQGRLGYEVGLPIYDAWESFFKSKISELPPSLSGGFQCTPEGNNPWHWLKVQKTLVDSALRGIAIGICLAFVVITVATQNIVIGFLATVSIACVTVTIMAIIPMVGWKLGVLESLNLSLVVGLSVDYVVHLAEGYHMSIHTDRKSKVRDMLESVGVSISSGAASTLGASIFMLFAKILFFVQFGIFMFCTIGFSLIYSLGLFSTGLAIVGPQGNFGSLVPLWKRLAYAVQGRKPADETCDQCKGKGFRPKETAVVVDSPRKEGNISTNGEENKAFSDE
ncbi:protein dispatched homolog 1-like [Argopecten irradians]|uniref:protein dispatched homolog 1-like n=1 Tax=Argopecten irradians TaxID=31199 RepID=UPI00371EF69D